MPLLHPEVDILRYRDGDLDEAKKRSVDKHLQGCAECREYLAFVDDFQAGLRELTPEEFTGTQKCPEPELIFDYEQGKLDDDRARELRAHMLFCDTCTDELYALRRLHHPRSFTQAVIRIAKKALQVLDISGTGEVPELAEVAFRSKGKEETRPESQYVLIEDTVTEEETKQSSRISVDVEAAPDRPAAALRLLIAPPRRDWEVSLSTAEGRELKSAAITDEEMLLSSPVVDPGSYTLQIRKGEHVLADFMLDIQE
jgi:hypothetical protein